MFRISDQPIQPDALRTLCRHDAAGGFCSFEGWVRNHHAGKSVLALDYQAYRELAEAEGQRIVAEAMTQFAVQAIAAEHRVGSLQIGDLAVYVGVSAAHRDAAFAACRYVIDEIKKRVPIWKREHDANGSSEWLHP